MILAGKAALLRGATMTALAIGFSTTSSGALAQARPGVRIAAQDLGPALLSFSRQSGRQIMFAPDLVRGKRASAVSGAMATDQALATVLQGSGLTYRATASGAYLIVAAAERPAPRRAPPAPPVTRADPPPPPPPASPNDIIVTAQKRRESIQDVPIAISAFTQETLDKQKIEGGPDLLKAVPNLTFSKSNFAGYNLEIRGIGTKAISVTTDPGVAINFNSSTLITNRFFEQEFFDLERVEVLRGPQGTLYGRNATGGVVNIISAKPDLTKFDGYIKSEVGNFQSRRAQGAINIPVIPDLFGLRLAGAYTNRNGFTTNDLTMNRIDGRDLYTTRVTASLKPSSRLRSDFIWERFSENDNRARTAKQLCHRDPGNSDPSIYAAGMDPVSVAYTSQGCKDGSLYDDGAYGVPNGLSLPYVLLGLDPNFSLVGVDKNGNFVPVLKDGTDPYASTTQTHNIRQISSIFDPEYRAHANVLELNTTWDINDQFAVTAQSAYNRDHYYSTQDYNRFNTVPVFSSTDNLTIPFSDQPANPLLPGGYYDDPQLGRSNRLVARDLVTARSKQFSQELRIATVGRGRFQGTVGGNYTYYKNQTDYYVFVNILSAFAQSSGIFTNKSADPNLCNSLELQSLGITGPVPTISDAGNAAGCIYIDPNSFRNINGQGHNYFRSSNRFYSKSFGAFGDGTFALTRNFKLIGGLRYNDDLKVSTPVPSQLLLSTLPILAGTVNYGYPANPDIRQHFRAVTGRAGWQWSPRTAFTDNTMIYATYSRGYKAGGTNPPPVGFSKNLVEGGFGAPAPASQLLSYPDAFKPEYVNSLELGTKNTLLNNTLTLNLTGYFYSFRNYQVSQIEDRQAINENFDTKMYGLEAETVWQPSRALRLNANLGLQNAKLNRNQLSIDVIDRLQGHEDKYLLVKPFVQLPSNCVISKAELNRFNTGPGIGSCPGSGFFSQASAEYVRDHPDDFPNGGRGFYADVGGNQLPNAPHFTINVGAEYNIPFAGSWVLTPRADFYHQAGSYARVYNDAIDRLRGWENVNVSLRVGNPEIGLLVEAYVKNVFDDSPITDAFINSDDTGLTTNVFTFDPRIIGVNVTKKF